VAVFLIAGAVDSLIVLASDLAGQGNFLSVFGQLAVTGALALFGFVLASLALVLAAVLTGRRPIDARLLIAFAAGFLFFIAVVLAAGLNSFSEIRQNLAFGATRLFIGLAAALFTGVIVWRLLHSEKATWLSAGRSVFILALLGPILTLAAGAIVALKAPGPEKCALPVLLVLGASVAFLLLPLPAAFRNLRTTMVLFLVVATVGVSAGLSIRQFQRIGPPPHPVDKTAPKAIPRIVLITIDTLRRDAVGAYDGNVETPEIDALAKESTLFVNAYSASPWTVPSFVSMFTGVGADIHGTNKHVAPVPECYPTLAEILTSSGYNTVAIGRHPNLLRMGRGFSTYDFHPRILPWHRESVGSKLLWKVLYEAMATSALTDRACAWLEQNKDKEFFLWVHYIEPHIPYEPPRSYVEGSPGVDIYGTKFADDVPVRCGTAAQTPEEREWMHGLYNGCVRFTDAEVGRMLDCLKSLGLYDGTLLVLTTDHGEEFWDHDGWEHGHTLYNELVKVPFLVRLPGQREQKSIITPVTNASIMPTLLDLCGIPAPESVSFTVPSLARACSGDEPQAEPIFISKTYILEPREAVVFDHYKFIRRIFTGRVELYDLDKDPQEQHNIASLEQAIVDKGTALLTERAEFRQAYQAKTAAQSHPEGGDTTIDRALQEQLRNIGYVD